MARADVDDLPRNEAGISRAAAMLAERFGNRFQAGRVRIPQKATLSETSRYGGCGCASTSGY